MTTRVAVMGIIVEKTESAISALAGKIGNIDGISVKTSYSNVAYEE